MPSAGQVCVFCDLKLKEAAQPWKVGGRLPSVSSSNSTDSILNFGICSAIIGSAICFTVLQIAWWIYPSTFNLMKEASLVGVHR